MRVKAGGGGNKEDDGEEQDSGNGKDAQTKKSKDRSSSGNGGGGGAEAVGRVNNLVGTDVDVITSSLVSRTTLILVTEGKTLTRYLSVFPDRLQLSNSSVSYPNYWCRLFSSTSYSAGQLLSLSG